MSIKFTKLSTILLVAGVASLFADSVKAEMMPLDDKFQDAYFTNGKNAFTQSNALSQINTILGFTGFPEQHISRDGKKVDKAYQEGMAKQSAMGARMITRDLTNPYDTSLRESPSYSPMK
jgi:hypothetical protein